MEGKSFPSFRELVSFSFCLHKKSENFYFYTSGSNRVRLLAIFGQFAKIELRLIYVLQLTKNYQRKDLITMMAVHFNRVIRKTEKAVLCDFNGTAIWLPLSKCKFFYNQQANDFKCHMPEWLFYSKGFDAMAHNGRNLYYCYKVEE